jgi:hypothetical protein
MHFEKEIRGILWVAPEKCHNGMGDEVVASLTYSRKPLCILAAFTSAFSAASEPQSSEHQ